MEDLIVIQKVVYIGLLILGVAMSIFLYFNFSKNINRKSIKNLNRHSTSSLDTPTSVIDDFTIDDCPQPTALCSVSGTIQLANKSFCEIFGTSLKEIENLNLFNVLPSQIIDSVSLKESATTNQEKRWQSKITFFSRNTKKEYFLTWQKIKNRSNFISFWITLEASSNLVNDSISSSLLQVEPLQDLIDLYPMALFIENMSGELIAANKRGCYFQGVNPSQLKHEVIINRSLDEYRNMILQEHLDGGDSTKIFTSIFYPKFGKALLAEIRVAKVYYDNQPVICYIINEITESTKLSMQLEYYKVKVLENDRLKSSFLANLSHEVRAPLKSVLRLSELLAEHEIDIKERAAYLKTIRESGQKMLTQINNLNDYSKIEAGLINIKVELYPIETLFYHLHEYATEENINATKTKLYFNLPNEIAQNNIATDKYRLKQILTIFLSNSIKFARKGVIEIGVVLKAPQLYEFYIKCSRNGVLEDKFLKIFEPLRHTFSLDDLGSSSIELGLPISARLIQLLGGHQWVVFTEGKSTELRFVIPDFVRKPSLPMLQVSGGSASLIKKVAIISPTHKIYNNLRKDVKPINYQVFWAQNSEELKAMLMSNRIEIVLIDIDEIIFWQDLIISIKEIQEKTRLIGISNRADTKRKRRLMTMGLDNVIKTTVNIPIILNIIENEEITTNHLFSSFFNQN